MHARCGPRAPPTRRNLVAVCAAWRFVFAGSRRKRRSLVSPRSIWRRGLRRAWPAVGLSRLFASLTIVIVIIATMSARSARSEEEDFGMEYIWRIDKSSGKNVAISRNEMPTNFMVVGNLSAYSFYLVEHWIHFLANAAGSKIDRKLKSFSLVVVHDELVFSRLKNERASFEILGIPSFMIDDMQNRARDGVKCLSSSFEGDAHDILVTVILLNEKYNGCLIQGIFYSFGIKTGIDDDDFNLKALLAACVLYEGRRANIRDREELHRQRSALAKRCFEDWGGTNGSR
jgi:hypothetical protein